MQPVQLLTWRKANALSQEAAARHLGVSSRTYARYERGGPKGSRIPETVAGMVMAAPNVHAPDVEVAPPYGPKGSETPWTHPRLFKKDPKKLRWTRLQPGEPILAADDPTLYQTNPEAEVFTVAPRKPRLPGLRKLPSGLARDLGYDGDDQ